MRKTICIHEAENGFVINVEAKLTSAEQVEWQRTVSLGMTPEMPPGIGSHIARTVDELTEIIADIYRERQPGVPAAFRE